MIIWDDGFWGELYDSRTCAIEGKKGSGKTMLALDIAETLLKKGYKLETNMSCIWNDNGMINTGDPVVVICDEGGAYLRTAKSVNNFSRFLRKLDRFLILPCKKLPHEELCELTISPWFNFNKHFGIPIKIWRWDVTDGRKSYNGKLYQVNYRALYGVYSSIDPGDFPEIIMQNTIKETNRLFERYKRRYELSDVGSLSDGSGYDESVELARDINSAARSFRESLSMVGRETTSGFGKKKRSR